MVQAAEFVAAQPYRVMGFYAGTVRARTLQPFVLRPRTLQAPTSVREGALTGGCRPQAAGPEAIATVVYQEKYAVFLIQVGLFATDIFAE